MSSECEYFFVSQVCGVSVGDHITRIREQARDRGTKAQNPVFSISDICGRLLEILSPFMTIDGVVEDGGIVDV